jgi:hypothetical protein
MFREGGQCEDSHVMIEAKTGMLHLQVKQYHEFLANNMS